MEKENLVIRLETTADYDEVEDLTREAFWNVYRPGCLEHYVLHCLRNDKDFVPELDFVLVKNGQIIGQIAYMRAQIKGEDGSEIPVMAIGPVGILPEYQRQGYGKALLDYSMEKARIMGVGAVCLEGNIDFYGKSGFVVAGTKGIRHDTAPEEKIVPHFLLKELTAGYLDGVEGVYYTPQGYYVDEAEAEEYDRHFRPKEKRKLPGQLV